MCKITKYTLQVLNLKFDHLASCSLSTAYHKHFGLLLHGVYLRGWLILGGPQKIFLVVGQISKLLFDAINAINKVCSKGHMTLCQLVVAFSFLNL